MRIRKGAACALPNGGRWAGGHEITASEQKLRRWPHARVHARVDACQHMRGAHAGSLHGRGAGREQATGDGPSSWALEIVQSPVQQICGARPSACTVGPVCVATAHHGAATHSTRTRHGRTTRPPCAAALAAPALAAVVPGPTSAAGRPALQRGWPRCGLRKVRCRCPPQAVSGNSSPCSSSMDVPFIYCSACATSWAWVLLHQSVRARCASACSALRRWVLRFASCVWLGKVCSDRMRPGWLSSALRSRVPM